MTRWGIFLLLLYLGLGLSSTRTGKAVTLSICLTAVVVTAMMAKYMQ
jgi:hypothetical protein